ncbi:N-Acylglucosamine 2-Epimerase [Manis pentadactyla]|nr:N-Acylglucosamine 2-Epimerase [Manis pentadactyla]
MPRAARGAEGDFSPAARDTGASAGSGGEERVPRRYPVTSSAAAPSPLLPLGFGTRPRAAASELSPSGPSAARLEDWRGREVQCPSRPGVAVLVNLSHKVKLLPRCLHAASTLPRAGGGLEAWGSFEPLALRP